MQPALKNLALANQFTDYSGVPRFRTQLRIVLELILKRYSAVSSDSKWITFIERFGQVAQDYQTGNEIDETESYANLAEWIESGEGQEDHSSCGVRPSPMTHGRVALYRCSHCGNASAALRKCSGCGKARYFILSSKTILPSYLNRGRYCDAPCQKAHWPEHKTTCKTTHRSR